MKFFHIVTYCIAAGPIKALSTTGTIGGRRIKAGCDAAVSLDATSNIWLNYTLHPNIIYRQKVVAAIEAISDSDIKSKAIRARFSDQGTFVWVETREDIKKIEEAAQDVPCNHALGVVLAALPYKDCLSIGIPPATDPWNYQTEFIDAIVKAIKTNPNTAFALIVEPAVMASYVLNSNSSMCEHVKRSYRENVPAALKSLDLPNVVTYLDAAHGGVFGWKVGYCKGCIGSSGDYVDNPVDAALELDRTWVTAGKPKQFRGLAVNVKRYNSWDMSPGEAFTNEQAVCASSVNKARNEKQYLRILKSALVSINSTMPFHAIMDSARTGVQGIRAYWSDWCNVNEAGFGTSFTSATRDENLDAFVWVTNGGLSDGTSDSDSVHYQSNCGERYTDRTGKARDIAYKPMPEKGEWSQSYFEMLVKNGKMRTYGKRGSRTVADVQPLPSYKCEDGKLNM